MARLVTFTTPSGRLRRDWVTLGVAGAVLRYRRRAVISRVVDTSHRAEPEGFGKHLLVPDSGHCNICQVDRQLSPQAVREQLERILASAQFVATDRLKCFLRFVIEEKLAGRAHRLKAYTIALEAFGRGATFDPQTDPVVRMEAGRLRRRLERYYLGPGRRDPIRIEIPKGGYAPKFILQQEEIEETEETKNDRRTAASTSRPGLLRIGPLGLIGMLVAGLSLFAAIWFQSESPSLAKQTSSAATQTRGPAIIVLPFENLSGVEIDAVFADGLVEELSSNLMRFGEFRLYSVHDNFRKEQTADLIESGERSELGYVIKGSIRRGANRVRLTAHLIEVSTGQHLWTETYDRKLTPENVFIVQEQVADHLASRLAQPYGIIQQATVDSFRHQRPETLFAYDCVLRALAYRRTQDRALYMGSRVCLEEAVRRDPGYADPWAMLAAAYLDEFRFGYGSGGGKLYMLDLALDTARHASDLDPDNVLALLTLASVRFYRREFVEAEKIDRRLMLLNPTNPEVLAQVGWRTAFSRDWDEGMKMVRKAIDRSIKTPDSYHLIMALHHFRQGDYHAALAESEKIAMSDFVWVPVVLAAIHGELGDWVHARRALDRAMILDPSVLKEPREALRTHNVPDELIDQLMHGLRKAGLEVRAAFRTE